MSNVEFNIYKLEQNPNHDIGYFAVKEAMTEKEEAGKALARTIKAMRIYKQGEEALKLQLQYEYDLYKKAVNQGCKLRDKYLEQCKTR